MKTCTVCKESKSHEAFRPVRLRNGKMALKARCRQCESKYAMKWQEENDYCQDIQYVFYQRAYGIIRDRRAPVGFSCKELKEYLISLWEKQHGKCYYTGKNMVFNGYTKNIMNAVTVDRVEPSLGYVKDNIVVCCAIVNRIKQNLSLDELKYWVDLIVGANVPALPEKVEVQ